MNGDDNDENTLCLSPLSLGLVSEQGADMQSKITHALPDVLNPPFRRPRDQKKRKL